MERLRPFLRPPYLIGAAVALVALVLGAIFGPLALSGPRVLSVTPADGTAGANPQAPIRVELSQPAQPGSLAGAFSFDPPAEFTAATDGNAVVITPVGGLQYGASYRLTIGAGLRNQLGRALEQPVTVSFTTVPHLSVAQMSPADGAEDVPLRGPITVEFGAPVVPAEQIAAAAADPALADALPQPVSVAPAGAPGEAAPGVGRWLSPTLFGFYPSADLRSATSYQATVRADVTPDGSARLAAPLSWTFTTAAPLLVEARPSDGAAEVPANGAVTLRLAEDVDLASAQASFQLRPADGGAPVQGAFQPAEGGFSFVPAAPLATGARYEASLAAGVRSRSGALLNDSPISWAFTVIGDLAVEQVEPLPGTTEVPTTTGQIVVRFNHPVVALTDVAGQALLPQPLVISPALAGVGRWIDTSTYVYSPTSALAPATSYEATVAAGLADQAGAALRQEYRWSFATITPQVVEVRPGGDFAPPGEPIRVFFNQPMDPASTAQAISLERDGASVPGSVAVSGSVATFTPDAPLERGASYVLNVARGARAAQGAATLADGGVFGFRVAPLPALVASEPASGASAVDAGGSVRLAFSAPMNWGSVEQSMRIIPSPTEVYTSAFENELYLYFELVPESDYTITIGGAARDAYGVAIGQDTTINFRTAPLPPALELIGAFRVGVYNANVPVRVPYQAVNVPSARYQLYGLGAERAAGLLGSYEDWNSYEPDPGALLAEQEAPVQGQRNRYAIGWLELGALDAGIYYLTVEGEGGGADRQVLVVSPYALTIKRSPGRVFVWAVDLATGRPAPGLELHAASYSYSGSRLSAPAPLGRTDADGVIDAPFAQGDLFNTLYIWAPGERAPAFATSDWSSGIGPWDFGQAADYEGRALVGNLSTDRPIYRPAQTVFVRGALRLRESASGAAERYRLPTQGQQASLVVSDPEGNTVLTRTLALSAFGTFNTDLPIEEGAPLGAYTMIASLDGDPDATVYGTFTVAEYRRPTFEVAVTPARPDVVQGETVEATVEARYFSGGALANAPLRWRLLSSPLFFTPESAPDYRFENFDDAYDWYSWGGESGQGGTLVGDGEATTDAQGRFVLRAPADLYAGGAGASESGAAPGRVLTLDIEVTDVDGQVIAAQARVNIHPGAFYIGLRPAGYVAQAGQPQQVDLITLDAQGNPVPGRTLEVSVFRREWYSVREQGEDGRLYWTSRYTDTLEQTLPAATDAQARGSVSFTPSAGGSYRITASGRDDAGNAVQSTAFTWAYGSDVFWGVDDTSRVDLIADRQRYRPGETAGILVTAPYQGMTALMTIERSNVIEHRLFTIQGTTELIQVPISADYAPNVYVSLVLVKAPNCDPRAVAAEPALFSAYSADRSPARQQGLPPCRADSDSLGVPDVRVGLINLPVSTEQQELTVTVTPDKTGAGPRDTITYAIKATDHTGRGVRAELSLALVDKAVLTLADDPNPTLRESFYTRRSLGVMTAQSLTALVDRVTLRLQPGDKGGGGGEAAPTLRTEFPDTAYWNPAVVTGDDGTAQVTVTLPDSLTTWRMSARAISADTLVGEGASDIIATRPLLIRPSLPRFLTAGDRPTLQAVVQNNTGGAFEAVVTLDLGAGESPIQIDGPLEQRVQLAAGAAAVVRWPAVVAANLPDAPGSALTLRMAVAGGGEQDAVEARLPIQRFVTAEVVASAGQARDGATETIQVPTAGGPGQVDLELAPSLAAGIYGGLGYLEAFPYECSEQTVGKFLPNAVTYRMLRQAGIDDARLKASLEQNLAAGAQRLRALQQLDGGWGWWENDESDPYITAYVVQGLVEAGKAGYPVDQRMLDDGLAYIEAALAGDALDPSLGEGYADARSFALFVLAEAGRPDRGRSVALFEQRSRLQHYGRAYLLMTLHALGEGERARTLVAELTGSALLSTTEAHWEERRIDYWTMSSNTRTTALALQALVRADPQSFLVPNAVRYLMAQRNHGHWQTTQESAISAMALAEYVAQSGELEADYTYRALLDGAVLREGSVAPGALADPVTIVLALAGASQPAINGTPVPVVSPGAAITIEQQGRGQLYYTVRARSYADAATARALDRGIAVRREYVAVASDTLTPTGELVREAKLSDVVQVRLTITLPRDMSYLAVEDMLPAGLEPLDASLKTVSAAAAEPELGADGSYPYWWYWSRSEVRDNRVALFATELPRGTYTYTYLARATTPGSFGALPATAYQMYAPEVFGRSDGAQFTVTAP